MDKVILMKIFLIKCITLLWQLLSS